MELALTRIFSVVFYYHFAFLAISIALFGLGAGGVFSYVVAARPGNVYQKLGSLALSASVSVLLVLWFILSRQNNDVLDAGRGLFRDGGSVLPRRDHRLDRHFRSHRARPPRLFLRPGGRGRRLSPADLFSRRGRRTRRRDRRRRRIRDRRRALVQPGPAGQPAHRGGSRRAAHGDPAGGQRQDPLVRCPLGQRASASPKNASRRGTAFRASA